LYINELLIRLLPKDASQEDLFNLYEDFLTKIHGGDDVEFTLRHFELDLLDMLGYGLDFENDIDKNEQIDPDKNYSFIPQRGFRESDNSNFSGKDIINIRIRDLAKVSKKHLKHITQEAIHFCLDGRDLSSRDIFKRIQS
jgi:DNA repair protein RecO (recombination protein O)